MDVKNIKDLLIRSRINWTGDMNKLIEDFSNITELITSLPEPEDLDASILTKYAALAKDEYDKKAEKKDICKEDMYKI